MEQPSLDECALKHGTDKSSRFHDYCHIYERELPKKVRVLVELGVLRGASIRMWRDYYPDASIFGVDIDDISLSEAFFIQCDLSKAGNLTNLCQQLGDEVEVLIDDAGHESYNQFLAFNHLWPCIKPGGVYVVEDTHTSYESKFTDDRGFHFNMVEWLKTLVDVIHWQGRDGRQGSRHNKAGHELTPHEETVESITFYKSLCFIRKCKRKAGAVV